MSFSFTIQVRDGSSSSSGRAPGAVTCSAGKTEESNPKPDSGTALQLEDAVHSVEALSLSPGKDPSEPSRAPGDRLQVGVTPRQSTAGSQKSGPGQHVQTVPCSSSTMAVSSALPGVGGARGGVAELERRQAEKRKEMMKPKTAAAPSPRAWAQKLEREAGGPMGPAVVRIPRTRRSPGSGPDNKNVKQMLLDWCRAKTRNYENVDIQNFSSSWSDGLAFCALIHNFFPAAFDYSALRASERRNNFHTAFRVAEELADCPPLLDVDDLLRMEEPDWKCIYTYIQELYRSLVEKGLVKTKKSS